MEVYRNNMKNRESDEEASRNSSLERESVVSRQGSSEERDCGENPTLSEPDSSCCFGINLGPSWGAILSEEIKKDYFQSLLAFLDAEKGVVYPPRHLIFNAFLQTPFEQVKVVMVGQDPYHGPGQAEGLCFSVPKGVAIPPSLRNIFLELQSDLKIPPASSGSLVPWAKQGVLLLNATLTVRASEPLSHHKKGWERFTDAVIEKLIDREDPLIFVLWGRSAKEKVTLLARQKKHFHHQALMAAHPSPLSAHNGFWGCGHFSKVNTFLKAWKKEPIDW